MSDKPYKPYKPYKFKPKKNKISYLFNRRASGRAWNLLRDSVRNKTYKTSQLIYPANVDENEVYLPTTNIRSTNLEPLTNATQINPLQSINDYENTSIGHPIKIGTVEGNIKNNRSLLSNISSTIMRKPQLPPIERIPIERSPEPKSPISKKKAGSKLHKQIFSKKKNKQIRKTYKKKMHKL